MTLRRTLVLASLVGLAACGNPGPVGKPVDVAAAAASGNCEADTAALRVTGETMLPGRVCGNCHRAGGQAASFPWTVSGTVFGSSSASCNTGGLAGVKVEIFEGTATTAKLTLMTNSVGNFYTNQAVTFPIRAKVSKGAMSQQMVGLQVTGACATCHQNPPAGTMPPGRLFLN